MDRRRSPKKADIRTERSGFRTEKWLLAASVAAALLAGILIGALAVRPEPSAGRPAASIGTDFLREDDALLLYLEAMALIKNHDAYLESGITKREFILESLKAVAERTDPFAAYMTAEEFVAWRNSQGDEYAGIGMEIIKDKEGRTICLPYPDSPAAMAGIRPGDELTGIAGRSVKDRSVLAVGAMARGASDTGVRLKIRTGSGEHKELTVKRAHVSAESVTSSLIENIRVIGMSAFTRDSRNKLASALAEAGEANPLVIDLRGNAGGDLTAATESAKLFLTGHRKILSIRTRQGMETYESGDRAMNAGSPLFIWQDGGTASAAEAFIAALTRNHRARSIGKPSFGKGSRQKIFELSDGSALFLTTGFLQAPDGFEFDGKGLNPDYEIGASAPLTDAYLRKVKELLKGLL